MHFCIISITFIKFNINKYLKKYYVTKYLNCTHITNGSSLQLYANTCVQAFKELIVLTFVNPN